MNRDEALALMEQYLGKSANLKRHSLASEAVMKSLALKLAKSDEEAQRWGILGLLHDLDYLETESSPALHGLKTAQYLENYNFSEDELLAIKRHNAEMLGLTRQSELDLALTAGEVITGLIMASALVRPDKKISEVKTTSVLKKMKDKSFAKGANREHIKLCEQFNLPLADFVTLAILAMGAIEGELNL
ncbi:MAG: hypothetical protein ACRCTY_03390 [Candidatus Adiutrix sp.]